MAFFLGVLGDLARNVSQLQIGEKLLLMHRRDGMHAKGCIDDLLNHGILARYDPG